MNADEIVRALRDLRCGAPDCNGNFECGKVAVQAADLIDSLTTQLAASQRRERSAVADIWNASANAPCAVCAHGFANTGTPCTVRPCKFEWRGPQEAGKGEARVSKG